jgi:hypothetical protein
MGDPVDWAAWAYGKIGHWGLFILLAALGAVAGIVWIRGVEKYKKEHQQSQAKEVRVGSTTDVEHALVQVREAQYRSLVADVIHAMEPNAYVSVGGEVIGPDGARTVDVQVWPAGDRTAGPTIVDVIDLPNGAPARIGAIDHLDSKRRDLPVKAALISSNTGFERDAISKAKRIGIGLITVLKQGDSRASVIEEEVYLRTVTITNLRFSYAHGGKTRSNFAMNDVTYRGHSVDAWLRARVIAALGGIVKDTNGLILYYRTKRPVDFNAPGGKLRGVTQIAVLLDATVQWASQIVHFNAKTAIHDYIRGRTRLAAGANALTVSNVDWETATLLSEPPQLAPFGSVDSPGPSGEVDLMLMRIRGLPMNGPPASDDITQLIEPEDLKPELTPIGMRQMP